MVIQIKRAYEIPDDGDGQRILVDRLWPRGISKEKAKIDFWAKAIAPSNELRRWYGHDPEKWTEFKARYFAELDAHPEQVAELREHLAELREHLRKGTVTFVYSSTERKLNNAVALREYLASRPGK